VEFKSLIFSSSPCFLGGDVAQPNRRAPELFRVGGPRSGKGANGILLPLGNSDPLAKTSPPKFSVVFPAVLGSCFRRASLPQTTTHSFLSASLPRVKVYNERPLIMICKAKRNRRSRYAPLSPPSSFPFPWCFQCSPYSIISLNTLSSQLYAA